MRTHKLKTRRMFDNGPIGIIDSSSYSEGLISVEFRAEDVLWGLGAREEWHAALRYYAQANWIYTIDLVSYAGFIKKLIGLDVEMDFANRLYMKHQGSAGALAVELTILLEKAIENGWNSIDFNKYPDMLRRLNKV